MAGLVIVAVLDSPPSDSCLNLQMNGYCKYNAEFIAWCCSLKSNAGAHIGSSDNSKGIGATLTTFQLPTVGRDIDGKRSSAIVDRITDSDRGSVIIGSCWLAFRCIVISVILVNVGPRLGSFILR